MQGPGMAGKLRQTMPTLRALEDAADESGLGRRTLSRWVAEGKLTAYGSAGDRKRYVDMDAIKRLRKPKPLTPSPFIGVPMQQAISELSMEDRRAIFALCKTQARAQGYDTTQGRFFAVVAALVRKAGKAGQEAESWATWEAFVSDESGELSP